MLTLDSRTHIAAVLFDMDGVVADNTHFHQTAWVVYAREALGIALDPEAPKYFHGRNREIVARLLGRPLSAPEAELHNEGKEARYRDLARGQMRPVAGLTDYLDWLDHLDLPKALVTNSDPVCMAFVLEELGLAGRFAVMVNADDVTHAKPHPEPYLKAAGFLGIDPKDCVVVEDAPAGIRAGKAAGARVIGFPTTSPKTELQAAGADWIVANCASIRLCGERGDGSTLTLELRQG